MIPFERQKYILNQLQSGSTYIEDLVKLLDVSEITVRRDLKVIENQGFIELKHGGLVQLIDTTKETSMQRRAIRFVESKKKIAEKASEFVEPGDVIFIDSGTTTQFMIRALKDKNVTIVTNGLKNIEESIKYNVKIMSIGGELKIETLAFIGPTAIERLSKYNFNKCFLGANGVDLNAGLTNADENESTIKSISIENSTATYVLADSSKFDKVATYRFAGINQPIIITNEQPKNYEAIKNIIVV